MRRGGGEGGGTYSEAEVGCSPETCALLCAATTPDIPHLMLCNQWHLLGRCRLGHSESVGSPRQAIIIHPKPRQSDVNAPHALQHRRLLLLVKAQDGRPGPR